MIKILQNNYSEQLDFKIAKKKKSEKKTISKGKNVNTLLNYFAPSSSTQKIMNQIQKAQNLALIQKKILIQNQVAIEIAWSSLESKMTCEYNGIGPVRFV